MCREVKTSSREKRYSSNVTPNIFIQNPLELVTYHIVIRMQPSSRNNLRKEVTNLEMINVNFYFS